MSGFDDVVVGKLKLKLKLKGKPLDVKAVGISKKKKKKKHSSKIYNQFSHASQGGEAMLSTEDIENGGGGGGGAGRSIDYMTPAERRYFEQAERIQLQKLEKMAGKSHRDRVQEFNQYLANLSELYDIPKVGPG